MNQQTMSTNKAVSDQQAEEEPSSGLVAAGVEGPGESSIAPKSSTKKAVEGGNALTSASEAQTPSTNGRPYSLSHKRQHWMFYTK